jgi:hypothetical protein
MWRKMGERSVDLIDDRNSSTSFYPMENISIPSDFLRRTGWFGSLGL